MKSLKQFIFEGFGKKYVSAINVGDNDDIRIQFYPDSTYVSASFPKLADDALKTFVNYDLQSDARLFWKKAKGENIEKRPVKFIDIDLFDVRGDLEIHIKPYTGNMDQKYDTLIVNYHNKNGKLAPTVKTEKDGPSRLPENVLNAVEQSVNEFYDEDVKRLAFIPTYAFIKDYIKALFNVVR